MEQQVVSYIKKHTFLMALLVILGFLGLAAGQFYLYRQQMHLNKMVSEGLMQIKEMNEQNMYQLTQPAGSEPFMIEK